MLAGSVPGGVRDSKAASFFGSVFDEDGCVVGGCWIGVIVLSWLPSVRCLLRELSCVRAKLCVAGCVFGCVGF